jgi:hypothetical protein
MADNYLEKKMEEHRSPQRPAYRQKLTPRGTKPGELLIKFQPCRTIIADASAPVIQKLINELTAIGFKVTFGYPSTREGALLAQHSGAQFSPTKPQAADGDIMISLDEQNLQIAIEKATLGIKVNCADLAGDEDEAVSVAVWATVQLAKQNDFQGNMLKNIKIEGYIL